MSWSDTVTLVFRTVGRRAVRTLLTGLGVALGSGLLVALVTISSAADTNVISRLSHGGPVTAIKVAAAVPQPDQLDSDSFQSRGIHYLDDQSVAVIRRSRYVQSVVPVMTSEVLAVPPKGDPIFGLMVGTDLGQLGNLPITILAGRMPSPDSMTEVAVASSYLVRCAFAAGGSGQRSSAWSPSRSPTAISSCPSSRRASPASGPCPDCRTPTSLFWHRSTPA